MRLLGLQSPLMTECRNPVHMLTVVATSPDEQTSPTQVIPTSRGLVPSRTGPMPMSVTGPQIESDSRLPSQG